MIIQNLKQDDTYALDNQSSEKYLVITFPTFVKSDSNIDGMSIAFAFFFEFCRAKNCKVKLFIDAIGVKMLH